MDQTDKEMIKNILNEILCEKLMAINVKSDEGFFDMGLTSIELLHICNDLTKKLGHEVNILMFYQYPTVTKLTNALAEMNG